MLTRDDTVVSPFQDPEYHPPGGEPYYYTNAISDQAARFITEHHQQHADQPFFFYVAYTAAHWPMHALERDIARYKGKYDAGYEPIRRARFEREKQLGLIDPRWDLSEQAGDWEKVKNKAWEARCMEVYAAMIDCMDQGIGRIVDSLRQTGQLDNTLILFLQDNGGNYEATGRQGTATRADAPSLPALGPGFIETSTIPKRTRDGWPVLQGTGVMPGPADTYIAYGRNWANVSNTPFREYKHFVHEGGIATPLIAHWPAHITRRGELEKQPAHLIDLMATCVDLSGAAYPKVFAGHPIEPIFWEHEGNRAVREGQWKLVAKGPAGAWELYDMDDDRTEMHDLSSSEPARTHEMIGKWEAWAKRAHVIPWIWKPQYGEGAGASSGPVKFKAKFELKQGDALARDASPQVTGRSITIDADITKVAGDGVIVAQGGSSEGYSLYLKGGHAVFAVRRQKHLTVITAKEALPAAPVQLSAALAKDGSLTLSVNGTVVASEKGHGTLTRLPLDGLQVGRDASGAVGEYEAPFTFGGEIGRLSIHLSEK
jgi:arylsulfatase